MLKNLSIQMKILFTVAVILAASLSLSMISLFSYKQLQKTVLVEHERFVAHVEKSSGGEA